MSHHLQLVTVVDRCVTCKVLGIAVHESRDHHIGNLVVAGQHNVAALGFHYGSLHAEIRHLKLVVRRHTVDGILTILVGNSHQFFAHHLDGGTNQWLTALVAYIAGNRVLPAGLPIVLAADNADELAIVSYCETAWLDDIPDNLHGIGLSRTVGHREIQVLVGILHLQPRLFLNLLQGCSCFHILEIHGNALSLCEDAETTRQHQAQHEEKLLFYSRFNTNFFNYY